LPGGVADRLHFFGQFGTKAVSGQADDACAMNRALDLPQLALTGEELRAGNFIPKSPIRVRALNRRDRGMHSIPDEGHPGSGSGVRGINPAIAARLPEAGIFSRLKLSLRG